MSLALKLQAVFALPFLLIYAAKRFGWQKSLGAVAAGLATLFVISLPFFWQSPEAGKRLIASYTGAVGMYTTRSTEAYNFWHLTIGFDRYVRHLSSEVANSDTVPLIGSLTAQHFGLAFFLTAFVPIVWRCARRTNAHTLFWGVALTYIALFMLSTEMHERYILPGVALLAMLYGTSPGAKRLYPYWVVTTSLNNAIALIFNNHQAMDTVEVLKIGFPYLLFRGGSTLISVAQIALFVLTYRAFWQETGRETADNAPTFRVV